MCDELKASIDEQVALLLPLRDGMPGGVSWLAGLSAAKQESFKSMCDHGLKTILKGKAVASIRSPSSLARRRVGTACGGGGGGGRPHRLVVCVCVEGG